MEVQRSTTAVLGALRVTRSQRMGSRYLYPYPQLSVRIRYEFHLGYGNGRIAMRVRRSCKREACTDDSNDMMSRLRDSEVGRIS